MKEVDMLAIKHILFPIDFSERTCGAAPFVDAMASRFGAEVTLMSVAPLIWYSGMGEPGAPVFMDAEALKGDLETRLDTTFVNEFAHLKVHRVAEIGDPAETISQFARTHGVDLIMMPTHGYGPFRRLLLGSVAAKVLHDAQCPVWTGAHMEEAPAREHLACRTILCAVDGTPKSVPVMEWAAQFSKDTGAALRLVHAIPGMEVWPERQFDLEFEQVLRKEVRAKIENLQRPAGVTAPLCLAIGEVAATVRDEARRHGTDLIVIGRGLLHETLGRLRTHAYGIIREAPCPVISV
jgi:nucleotide-binding universal stress UspA family protein